MRHDNYSSTSTHNSMIARWLLSLHTDQDGPDRAAVAHQEAVMSSTTRDKYVAELEQLFKTQGEESDTFFGGILARWKLARRTVTADLEWWLRAIALLNYTETCSASENWLKRKSLVRAICAVIGYSPCVADNR